VEGGAGAGSAWSSTVGAALAASAFPKKSRQVKSNLVTAPEGHREATPSPSLPSWQFGELDGGAYRLAVLSRHASVCVGGPATTTANEIGETMCMGNLEIRRSLAPMSLRVFIRALKRETRGATLI
jgi:hypothetical protein